MIVSLFDVDLAASAWNAGGASPVRSPQSASLLIYEHGIVKADDLSRVNAAFFTMNGWVSVLFFVFWATDILLINQHV